MKVGYVRVSTAEQNTARQEVMMEQLGVEEIFIDKQSGKSADRPELKRMLGFVRKGDTLIVESISRLSRSTKDFLNIMDELDKKGVKFESQKEKIDTSTPTGQFMLTVFAAVAQLERQYILQRQAEGLALCKERGVSMGRERFPYDEKQFEKEYKKWKDGKITAVKAMETLGMKKNTFYRRVEEYEVKNNIRKPGEKMEVLGRKK